ncbi:hypothetical protein A5N86_11905 [Geobacillus thermoleovorans]|nr:hypothetical protein A5N86_11905 [Geobacillus thermoleovorans]
MQTERESHGRIIFHVDANSFFASCEIVRDPSLQKKPVVVAGDPKERKGIVLAASYVAVNYHFISAQNAHFFAHSFRKPSPLF